MVTESVATDKSQPPLVEADPAPPAPRPGAPAQSKRQPELDALRGFLLLWMTLTHLPTHASVYSNQPFGFVSAAEGFIFLSALLCGRIFGRKLDQTGLRDVAKRLGARAVRLYGYHLILLAVAFTVIAKVAIHTKQPSLQGLIDFYLAHPVRGVITSLLLIYRPPLLDILPMYILFLLATPMALWIGKRWGWRVVVIPSLVLWFAAQFGLRAWTYEVMTRLTHFQIPFGALGAFNLYAWQLVWAMGLWIGSGRPRLVPLEISRRSALLCSVVVVITLAIIRHTALWDVMNQDNWLLITDKWHLGALRLLNFSAIALLFAAFQDTIAKYVAWKPLVLLGQASLEVFCVHLLICFAALATVGDGSSLTVVQQGALIIGAYLTLYLVARLFAKKRFAGVKPRRDD